MRIAPRLAVPSRNDIKTEEISDGSSRKLGPVCTNAAHDPLAKLSLSINTVGAQRSRVSFWKKTAENLSSVGSIDPRVHFLCNHFVTVPLDMRVVGEKFGCTSQFCLLVSPSMIAPCGACANFFAITSLVEQNLREVQMKTKGNVFMTVKRCRARTRGERHSQVVQRARARRFLSFRSDSLSCFQVSAQ